ncbi:MAG TPA: DUF5518 domain-containing protein [Methanoregula sp.]|nr:DUF5518 domain-containing protein [Methanoregula sp.]
MEQEKMRFVEAIIAGVVVTVIFGIVTVNILASVPLAGPFIGGIVAGYVAGKDFLNGAKAGIITGFIGAVLVALDVIANIPFIREAVPQFTPVGGILFLVLALFYFPILSFIGGAIGGIARAGPKPAAGRCS